MRGATRSAFVRLVDEALAREVDFIVIAGDLYDGAWRDVGTGLFFNQQVSRLTTRGIRVVILHGNHDAESELRKLPGHPLVHTFDARRPGTLRLAELGVALHGQSFAQPAVTANLVDDYPEPERGVFNIGVGRNCEISHTIIDKNARIGDNVKLSAAGKADGEYAHGVIVRDGVLVVPKGAIIPSGAVV